MAISDKINNIPPLQKLIIFILFLTAIIGGFIYFVYMPDNAEINRIIAQIEGLNRDIEIQKVRLRRLPELKKEMEVVQKELDFKKEQLPPETEAVKLLEQIEKLGNRTGLDIKLWKPGGRKVNPNGLYVELPTSVEISGSYHEFGMFFDQISKFSRVVNVSNLKMGAPKQEKGKLVEPVTFLATAFAAVEKIEKKETPPAQGKQGKGK